MKHILIFITGFIIGAVVYHWIVTRPDPFWIEETQPIKVRQW